MLVAKATAPLRFSFNGYEFKLKRKEKLLFADDVFALLPKNIQSQFEKAHSVLPPFYNGEDLNGKTVLLFAQAAIGDAICMTPALREVKRRYPDSQVWVAISGKARPVLEGLPYIDKLLPHPTPLKEVNKVDYIVKAVEMVGKPQFNYQNMIQYFLWKFHLDFAEKETPDVVVDEEVKKELEEVFAKIREVAKDKKILLFHYLSSSIHRTLPPKFLKSIEDLIWDEYAPVICSLPEEDITVEVALDVYGIRAANLSSFMKDLRYLIAAVSLSDAVITADTATVHIAAALEKPTVLISGAIDPELRCSTYPTVIPVRPNYRGKTCVSPCMIHALPNPCNEALEKKQFYAPCLESIPPIVVYQALKDAELLVRNSFETKSCPICENKTSYEKLEVMNSHLLVRCNSCGLEFFTKAKDSKINENLSSLVIDPDKSPIIQTLAKLVKFFNKEKEVLVCPDDGFSEELANTLSGIKKVSLEEFTDSEEKFELIVNLNTLDSTEEPLEVLKIFYSKLEDSGILLTTTLSYSAFPYQVKGFKKYLWWKPCYPPRGLVRWKPTTLFFALKRAGFSQVKVFTSPVSTVDIGENLSVRKVEVQYQGKPVTMIDVSGVTAIVVDTLKFLPLNSKELGAYCCGIGIKGNLNFDWEKLISRIISLVAIDYTWGKD
ncbi:MAG: methyltransferase type 12 [Thermodesulfobacteria bacterium]|nr:methyltransferase type 12 [Thermodesulfobacteriota bacterium]